MLGSFYLHNINLNSGQRQTNSINVATAELMFDEQ